MLTLNSFFFCLLCQQIKHQYRDRAAERRILHGGFGMGPGQKNLPDVYNEPSSPVAGCPQEAASEALEMSFGAGSYARKLLKSMGWKEVSSYLSSNYFILFFLNLQSFHYNSVFPMAQTYSSKGTTP